MPECGGGRWTWFGDESRAVTASAEDKEAAWKWISLFSEAGNNALLNEATGRVPVVKGESAAWTLHPQRFVTATVDSPPFANLLPNVPETSDFVNSVWPVSTQRALTGEIAAEAMNAGIGEIYGDWPLFSRFRGSLAPPRLFPAARRPR